MIEHARQGNVHVVTLGDDANLIDPSFVARLHESLDAVEAASQGAAALVVTARGRFFSNGLDVAALGKLDRDGLRRFNREIARVAAWLARALDIVAPLADKDRGTFRTLKRTLWSDVARGLGVEAG